MLTGRETTASMPRMFSLERPLLGLIWLAWFGCLFGSALWYGNSGDAVNRIPLWGRMASSALLVAAGCLQAACSAPGVHRQIATCVAVGMACGLLGDLFNAELMPDFGANPVLGGIAAFGIGHVAYMAGFLALARVLRFRHRRKAWLAVIAWQLVALVGWFFAAYRGDPASVLIWPALPYSMLLAGTAGITSWLAAENRRFLPLAIGGGLFLVSDLILAVRLFHGSFNHAGEAVWFTYGPGQMLIVFSLIAVSTAFAAARQRGEALP